MKRFISLICVVLISGGGLLSACCPPNEKEPLEIQSETTTFYVKEEVLYFTLVNCSSAPIYYSGDFALDQGGIDENGNETWWGIFLGPEGDDRIHPALLQLSPQEEAVYPVPLAEIGRHHYYKPGRYRLCVPYYINGDVKTKRFATFEFRLEKL